jgi:hypothetical protein
VMMDTLTSTSTAIPSRRMTYSNLRISSPPPLDR